MHIQLLSNKHNGSINAGIGVVESDIYVSLRVCVCVYMISTCIYLYMQSFGSYYLSACCRPAVDMKNILQLQRLENFISWKHF